MNKLDKIGKAILRKERILNYSKKRDFITKLDTNNKDYSSIDNVKLLHWYIKGDELSDIREFKEFLETSGYPIKFFKYSDRHDEIQCLIEVANKELSKDYYYRLFGFLVFHGMDFFCEIFGIGITSLENILNLEPFE